jgi:hypothetical protein
MTRKPKTYAIKRPLLETLEAYIEAARVRTIDEFVEAPFDLLMFPDEPTTVKPYDRRRREQDEKR